MSLMKWYNGLMLGGDVIMIADELIENITKIANNEVLVIELED